MRLFLALFMILLCSSASMADVKILYDKNSKNVVLITEDSDIIIDEIDKSKLEVATLPGTIEDYNISFAYNEYQFKNNKLIPNSQKIAENESAKEKRRSKGEEIDAVMNRSYKNACLELESEGVVFKEIKCSDF